MDNETFLNAIWRGNVSTVREELLKGADPNAIDYKTDNHITALMLALETIPVREEIVQLLISKGANVNARDNKGNTALMCARNTTVAKLLISAGIDVNTRNIWGITPLEFYGEKYQNNKEMVELLKKTGAK